MSSRLRDCIKKVRACKTAAEERGVVAKELALIRTSFKNEETQYRHRNVAKLLYLHMLGYSCTFGQMESLKLIVSQYYSDKRIGYLSLMLLLDETQEVLMLVTNSMKNDMNHPNQYIVGLALSALANVSSSAIARDLAPEVEKLLQSSNPYIRKKAALCAVRIVRKVPDLIDSFAPRVRSLLSERNHGVLITGMSLLAELCELDAANVKHFRRLVPQIVRILKNLVLSGYAPEYDVGGIADPFLQAKIIKVLRILGRGSEEASDAMNDILAQVATNTEGARNAGNAVLYECVQTIMSIESEQGLKVLGVNLLARFLLNRDNNIRYVALNTLTKVVSVDRQAVQRHRNTIVDCLKDVDISIRARALELIYALVNESNVKVLVRELLNFLSVAEIEFRVDLTVNICMVAEKYAPSERWLIDTLARVMSLSSEYVQEETVSNLIGLIQRSTDESTQAYAVAKFYMELRKGSAALAQQTLVQTGLWTIGEYGNVLVNRPQQPDDSGEPMVVREEDVLDLVNTIFDHSETRVRTKQYALTALVKLSERFQATLPRLREMIAVQSASLDTEVQQRAVEYTKIMDLPQTSWAQIKSTLLERMPPIPPREDDNTPAVERRSRPSGDSQPSVNAAATAAASGPAATGGAPANNGGAGDLLGDLLGGSSSSPAAPSSGGSGIMDLLGGGGPAASPAAAPSSGGGGLLDLLGGGAPAPVAPSSGGSGGGALLDLLGGGSPAPVAPSSGGSLMGAPAPMAGPSSSGGSGGFPPIVAVNQHNILVTFSFQKQPHNPSLTLVLCEFKNQGSTPIQNFSFLAAVPKYLRLQMSAPSGTDLPPNNSGVATQQIKLANSEHGQRPILMKYKIEALVNGQPLSLMGDIANFPPGL